MKKVFSILFALCMAVSAMAAETKWTWSATSGSLGTASPANVTLNNKAWTVTRSSVVYTGFSSSCVQFGSSSGAETVTLTSSAFSGTIKSVAIECSSYNNAHKVSINVGGTQYLAPTATAKWTTVSSKSGTGTASGTITITLAAGSRAVYIKSITVITEDAACTAPTISTQPVGATYTQGASATALSIVASGSSVTYQWYKNSTNSTSGATSISGATSSSYTPSTASTGTTYYYCVASSSTCTTTSNIVAVTVNAPSYTVTARSNNESLGTVSGTTTITASPKACVGYASPAYTVTGGSATVNQDGNTFTVSGMTANVTVTINFAEQAHDTYIDNVQSESMDGNYCGSYTAPTITDKSQATSGTCEQVHYHFVGWVSAANKSNPTDANIVKAGTAMTADETTYYAVWAKEE